MSLKASSPKRRKQSHTDSNDRSHRDAVHLNKQAYEEREQACSYQDYLALITMANFNEHEIRHIPKEKFPTGAAIEKELLKRWNKLPLEERNKYENEAIDNDVFHQIAYTRIDSSEMIDDKCSSAQQSSIRQTLEAHWNSQPDAEKVVHKRVAVDRDMERKRLM